MISVDSVCLSVCLYVRMYVCMYVCQKITSESLDVGSSYLHTRYICRVYGSISLYKSHRVKVKVTGAKKVENPYFRNKLINFGRP